MVVGLWSLHTPYTSLNSSGTGHVHTSYPFALPIAFSLCIFSISVGVCRPSSASLLDVSATSDLLVRAQRNPCHCYQYLILATSRKLEKRIRTSSLGAALRIVRLLLDIS